VIRRQLLKAFVAGVEDAGQWLRVLVDQTAEPFFVERTCKELAAGGHISGCISYPAVNGIFKGLVESIDHGHYRGGLQPSYANIHEMLIGATDALKLACPAVLCTKSEIRIYSFAKAFSYLAEFFECSRF
jgi:hypothetical protein